MTPRAPALQPTERRRSLVDVTERLLRERGAIPSTKDIAAEAGVAEGTIFRVFGSKGELLDAVVGQAFCPAPMLRELRAVDVTAPLRERLTAIVAILQDRFLGVFAVMGALGLTSPPDVRTGHTRCTPQDGHDLDEQHAAGDGPRCPNGSADAAHGRARGEQLLQEFDAVIGADRNHLTLPPREVLDYLRLLTFSASHPGISGGTVRTPEQITTVLLDGLLAREPDRKDA